jgi:16S rRNA (uracil1498-N3)-methyltransferase
MQLFYDPEIPYDDSRQLPHEFTLNETESWHCVKVLRMRVGDSIRITDGKGRLIAGRLLSLNVKGCEVEILETTGIEARDYSIHIAVAPTKNMARFEWFLEKATEAGIDQITPLLCDRSEKISVRHHRLNKIITAAMKQSLGVYHPILNKPAGFDEFIRQASGSGRYIGWCETKDEPLLSRICLPEKDIVVLIGPEGDFSQEEVEQAKNAGYLPISLGKNRLRTETAALAACFAVHFANGKI